MIFDCEISSLLVVEQRGSKEIKIEEIMVRCWGCPLPPTVVLQDHRRPDAHKGQLTLLQTPPCPPPRHRIPKTTSECLALNLLCAHVFICSQTHSLVHGYRPRRQRRSIHRGTASVCAFFPTTTTTTTTTERFVCVESALMNGYGGKRTYEFRVILLKPS